MLVGVRLQQAAEKMLLPRMPSRRAAAKITGHFDPCGQSANLVDKPDAEANAGEHDVADEAPQHLTGH